MKFVSARGMARGSEENQRAKGKRQKSKIKNQRAAL
jgi:hypothetical protein